MSKKYIADSFVKNGGTGTNVLLDNGTTTPIPTGGVTKNLILDTNVTIGNLVQLKSNGKVEKITTTATNGGLNAVPDTPKYWFDYDYDPFNVNRVFASYIDTTNSKVTLVAGIITNGVIAWGTAINTGLGGIGHQIKFAWSKTIPNQLLVAYGNGSGGIFAVYVNGTVVTVGTNTVSSILSEVPLSIISNPTIPNQYIFLGSYSNNTLGDNTLIVVSVNGLSAVTLGTPLEQTGLRGCDVAYDLNDNSKFFQLTSPTIASTILQYFLITGTTISFITSWSVGSGSEAEYGKIVCNPKYNNSLVIIGKDDITAWIRAFTLSGTTLTQGNILTLASSTRSYLDKINLAFHNDGINLLYHRVLYTGYYSEVRRLLLNSSTLTLGDYIYTTEYATGTPDSYGGAQIKINPNNDREFSLYGRGDAGNLSGKVLITTLGSNLDSNAIKGIAQTSGVTTETKSILLKGIDANQTGLVFNSNYYVSLYSELSVSGKELIGKAISATELLLEEDYEDIDQIIPNIIGISEVKSELKGLVDLGNVSGTVNIDCSLGIHFKMVLTGAITSLTFSNYSTQQNKTITLELTGNFTITQPTTVKGDWTAYSGTKTNQIQIYLFNVTTPVFSSGLINW